MKARRGLLEVGGLQTQVIYSSVPFQPLRSEGTARPHACFGLSLLQTAPLPSAREPCLRRFSPERLPELYQPRNRAWVWEGGWETAL